MSRNRFFGRVSDVATTTGVANVLLVYPSATFTFWDAQTGGTQQAILEVDGVTSIATYHPQADGWCRPFLGPDGFKQLWAYDGASERFLLECWTADAYGSAATLVPTSVKNSAYSANPGELVLVDISTANVPITAPSGAAAGAQFGVQVWAVSAGVVGAFAVTTGRSGSDVFTKSGGPTSVVQSQLEHTIIFQMNGGVWSKVASHVSLDNLLTVNATAYAPLGASDQYLAFPCGDTVTAGMPVLTQELYFPSSTPLTDFMISQEWPNLASGTVVYQFTDWNPAAGTQVAIGTNTVLAAGGTATSTANTRSARIVYATGSSYTMPAGHFMRCYVLSTNGTGFWGAAPQVHLKQSGTFTLNTTMPSVPGTITPTPSATAVTLASTLATGAAEVLYVDTSTTPPTPVARTGTGTAVHGGLAPASVHTYVGYSLAPLLASAASSPVTSGPGSGSFSHFNAVSGGIDPAKWTVTLGSNTSPSPSVTVDGSSYAIPVSAAAGTGDKQDNIYFDYIEQGSGSSAIWSAGRFSKINYFQYLASDIHYYYISRSAFVNLATNFTTGIQIAVNASGVRVGIKTGGSFINLTLNGSTQATVTSVDASGVVPFETTHTTSSAVQYGACWEALPIAGDGSQLVNIYSGTTTQANDGSSPHGSLVLLTAVTITPTQRAAIPAGHFGFEQDGAQGTGAAETTRLKFDIATLSPIGH